MARATRIALLVLALLAFASGAAALGGCSQRSTTSGTAAATTAPQAAAAPPTIKLVEPVAGATIPSGAVKVSVQTTGLKFVMPGTPNAAGEGHVHFILDGQPVKMSDKPEYTFTGVAAGEHTLDAELVQNDAKSFSPPVKQEIKFTTK